ncbi:hypothetical protein EXIGLDRAFT_770911 [Exidia glandulosa HHB12029]|uniref:Uncharacterized protein n=1 Tax=Exidia glandulosa HHB12029 TaxID=1314781 RepID=A0A165GD57_EXIGL|nr:hypothetical protein EXIGLDRAFT_770911 [Exidia glandulosa HHB12029]
MDPIFDVFADKSGFVLNEQMAKAALAEPTYPQLGIRNTFADPPVLFCDRPKRPVGARPMPRRQNLKNNRATRMQHSASQTSTGSDDSTSTTPPTTASAFSDWDIVVKPSQRNDPAFTFAYRS